MSFPGLWIYLKKKKKDSHSWKAKQKNDLTHRVSIWNLGISSKLIGISIFIQWYIHPFPQPHTSQITQDWKQIDYFQEKMWGSVSLSFFVTSS